VRTTRTHLVISAAVLGLAGSALALPAANAATTSYAYTGSAYSVNTGAKSILSSGTVGTASYCGTVTATKTNKVAATGLSTAGSVGAATSSVVASGSGSNRTTTSTATTGAVNLLGGVIKADAITTKAVSAHTSTGFTQTGSAKITGLTVAGQTIPVSPKPNTKITLPLSLGSVVINQQTKNTTSHQMTVNALSVSLLSGNSLGLPATTLTVGHAAAALSNPINRLAYGGAMAGRVTLAGGTVVTPSVGVESIPCAGTGGATLTRTTAAVTAGTLALSGTSTSSVTSKDSATQTTATTTNTVQGASLLGGAVKLSGVTTKATATRTASTLTTSIGGTSIGTVTVNGKPVTINTKQNNKIDLAGIGTLWTRKVTKTTTGITVEAVELDLLTAQSGLKAGSVIVVGQASAGVYAS